MPIFHLFSVSPVEVPPHELPRVLYRDFMICAPSLDAAWARIAEWEGVVDAAEVWGAGRDSSEETYVITGPNTLMMKETDLGHHRHWREMQAQDGKYTHLHSGPLSIEQWHDNHFAQYLARTHPKMFASTDAAPGGVTPTDQSANGATLVLVPSVAANDDLAQPEQLNTTETIAP